MPYTMKDALIQALGHPKYAKKLRLAANHVHKENDDFLEAHKIQGMANNLNDGSIKNLGDKMAKEVIAAVGIHVNEMIDKENE